MGCGYGSGEPYTFSALKTFLTAVPPDGPDRLYDFRVLEAACGPAVAWLLIGILMHANVIEYGTSPRFGWLTPIGYKLREYVVVTELKTLLSDGVGECYCSCIEARCQPDCANPFFPRDARYR